MSELEGLKAPWKRAGGTSELEGRKAPRKRAGDTA
jgi:hypothetical protein